MTLSESYAALTSGQRVRRIVFTNDVLQSDDDGESIAVEGDASDAIIWISIHKDGLTVLANARVPNNAAVAAAEHPLANITHIDFV